MSKKYIISILAVAFVLSFATTPAFAQQSQRSVVSLLTETVQLADAEAQTSYWWATPSSPAWTQTDQLLIQKLRGEGISLSGARGESRISKIYRRPDLSLANASTLAELMGADRLVVGHVVYTQSDDVGPIGLSHVAARVELTVTRAGQSAAEAGQTLQLTRHAYADKPGPALEDARRRLVGAISDVVSSSISAGVGRVGWESGERLIGLQNVGRAGALDEVKSFLEGLEGVSNVEVRWAGQGIIALEINPGAQDTPDTIEYAIRALANQTFEEFSLARQPESVADGLAQFLVSEPTQPERP
jgi:hypothetical protein